MAIVQTVATKLAGGCDFRTFVLITGDKFHLVGSTPTPQVNISHEPVPHTDAV